MKHAKAKSNAMNNLLFTKNTILIVDDNHTNLGVIFNVLDEAGLEVLVAQDGESALQKIEYVTPDLILLDIMMPGIDGFETCTQLKSNPATSEIPIIFMTALANTEQKVKGLSLGAVDYITKPFQKEEVLARIKVQLEIRNLSKNLANKNQLLQEKIAEKTALENSLQQLNQELEKRVEERTAELQQAQLQLIQSEKMSTLGQLVAGVAHEINNPVSFIQGNLIHAESYIKDLLSVLELYQQRFPSPDEDILNRIDEVELDFVIEDLPKLISSMKVGIERISQISISLRTFSRADSISKVPSDIHEGLESALLILKHRLKANEKHPQIEVIQKYGNLPLVPCYLGQLNQVFINIIANAIDALEEACSQRTVEEMRVNPGQIIIHTEVSDNQNSISIRIKDNGLGMTEEVRNKIFDYLFTTKVAKKGTGLGLSISHQIVVEKHGGKLSCVSELGVGTEFVIEIPLI